MDETLAAPAGGERGPAAPATSDPQTSPPPWVQNVLRSASARLIRSLVISALAIFLIIGLLRDLKGFFSIIFLALFLSFAVEPAVNWLAARGWRRGVATGLIFVIAIAVFVALFALIVPAVISGFRQLIQTAPAMLDHLQRWAAKVGIDFSTQKVLDEIKRNSDKIIGSAANITGGLLGFGASIIGQVFKWATIGLFLFYFVAEGPRFRRAVCRRLPPARQEQVLFIWEQAIEKTGGYFYSRLLLAAINGTGMYITLRVLKVPFAAPLALFEGVVAEFIPIVGTYIAGVIPILVALLFHPPSAIGVVAYILVYQSAENYVLSPRLTARTMALHPAVAFAAALIGGSLGGILMAFLSLPAAAVIQAAIQEYARGYEIVDSELTKDPPPHVEKDHHRWRKRQPSPAVPGVTGAPAAPDP